MKFQYVSDLHLEFKENYQFVMDNWKSVADILILAGDICSLTKKNNLDLFFDKIQDDYEHIIYVPGNHEYYGKTIDLLHTHQNYSVKLRPNITLVNNQTIIIDQVAFVCSTMWSGVTLVASNFINDYRAIEKFSYKEENRMFSNACDFLQQEFIKQKENKNKVVAVTHHLPTYKVISKQFQNNPVNSAFACENENLFIMDSNIKYWIHGHSHDKVTKKIGHTWVCRNPLGYLRYNEGNDFTFNTIANV